MPRDSTTGSSKRSSSTVPNNNLTAWETIVRKAKHPTRNVTIALVGKYIELKEAYKSLCEALTHGGIANDAKVNICWVDSEDIESKGAQEMLKGMDGILVPGGFGIRGVEGKIEAVQVSRGRARYPTSASVSECSAP